MVHPYPWGRPQSYSETKTCSPTGIPHGRHDLLEVDNYGKHSKPRNMCEMEEIGLVWFYKVECKK